MKKQIEISYDANAVVFLETVKLLLSQFNVSYEEEGEEVITITYELPEHFMENSKTKEG